MVFEMNSDIKPSNNLSYGITKRNRKQQNECNYVLHNENMVEAIKMDSNPSYGRVQGRTNQPEYDVIIQQNPSYSSIPKVTTKMSEDEDQHGYVETGSHTIQNARYLKVTGSTAKEEEFVYDDVVGDVDIIKINPNPSYDSVSSDVKFENNPSYNVINRT